MTRMFTKSPVIAAVLFCAIIWRGEDALAQREGPADQGVRVGITYAPGTLPGLLFLGSGRGVFLDSVRAILRRDLDYSDRFEMITIPGNEFLEIAGPVEGGSAPLSEDEAGSVANYALYAALRVDFALDVSKSPDSGAAVTLFDVRGAAVRRRLAVENGDVESLEFRANVHQLSDAIVLAATGTPGIATSRLLFVRRGRLYRVDSDGAGVTGIAASGNVYSPTWHPEGKDFAYASFPGDSRVRIGSLDGESGDAHLIIAGVDGTQDFAPAFSPNGVTIVFARAGAEGTDIFSYNLADSCCLQRLTVGRFSDNLSPTFSPDGRQIAFVSTRPGSPQIYVMGADGTGAELFAPFDFGVTGNSYAPEWSPDGLNIAFHREISGSPQVFVMDVSSRTVKQLSSAGRNEDPTWGPDGRHLAYVSSRTGSSQMWVIDLETGRIRQVTRMGRVRLPSWSSRLD